MKTISIAAFKEVLKAEENNPSVDFVNVCTPAEYAEKHIPGVRSVPLDDLEARRGEFDGKKTIYIHCRSGRRGGRAIEKLQSLGVTAELVNVEGGTLAWEEAGLETKATTTRLPLMRQVFIASGSLIVFGSVLALFAGSSYLVIPIAAGIGLIFAGVSGWCGMAFFLAKMPWNRP